jgi:hypothetical protein
MFNQRSAFADAHACDLAPSLVSSEQFSGLLCCSCDALSSIPPVPLAVCSLPQCVLCVLACGRDFRPAACDAGEWPSEQRRALGTDRK